MFADANDKIVLQELNKRGKKIIEEKKTIHSEK